MSMIQCIYKTRTTEKPLTFNMVNQRTAEDVKKNALADDGQGGVIDWQGRYDLHRWLEGIFEDYGGKCGEYANDWNACNFIGASLEINEYILNKWEGICEVHQNQKLYFDDESTYLKDDLKAIEKMRDLLNDGWYLYYWACY